MLNAAILNKPWIWFSVYTMADFHRQCFQCGLLYINGW